MHRVLPNIYERHVVSGDEYDEQKGIDSENRLLCFAHLAATRDKNTPKTATDSQMTSASIHVLPIPPATAPSRRRSNV